MIEVATHSCGIVADDKDPISASLRIRPRSQDLGVATGQWMAALRSGVPVHCPRLAGDFGDLYRSMSADPSQDQSPDE